MSDCCTCCNAEGEGWKPVLMRIVTIIFLITQPLKVKSQFCWCYSLSYHIYFDPYVITTIFILSNGVFYSPVFLYPFPFASLIVHLKMRFNNHCQIRSISLQHIFLIFRKFDGDDIAWNEWSHATQALKTNLKEALPSRGHGFSLEPAMKPRMRAFSGLVTLLAVLNISWASTICSFVKVRFLLGGWAAVAWGGLGWRLPGGITYKKSVIIKRNNARQIFRRNSPFWLAGLAG